MLPTQLSHCICNANALKNPAAAVRELTKYVLLLSVSAAYCFLSDGVAGVGVNLPVGNYYIDQTNL